jgi:hypothetical protein
LIVGNPITAQQNNRDLARFGAMETTEGNHLFQLNFFGFGFGNTVQKHGLAMTPKYAVMGTNPVQTWTKERGYPPLPPFGPVRA